MSRAMDKIMQNLRAQIFLLFLVALLVSPTILFAQAPSILWQRCLGGMIDDYAGKIISTTDGGFAIAGFAGSDDGDVSGNHSVIPNQSTSTFDAWVVKLDAFGTIEWQKCFGGTDNDYALSIVQTYDGGYAVAGYTFSHDGDVLGDKGSLMVFKLDPLGNLLWQKCLGGSGGEVANSIIESTDEGRSLLLAGSTSSTDGDVSGKHPGTRDSAIDVWVVKLSSTGSLLWQKCFGGSAQDRAYSIINTFDHGYAFCGVTYSNDGDVSGFHGGTPLRADGWVVKLNSSGDLQWQTCIGGFSYDVTSQIIQTSDSGYVIAGATSSNDGDVSGIHINKNDPSNIADDAWIIKLSSSGKIERQKCLGGSERDNAESILQDLDGNFIVAATTNSLDGDVTPRHAAPFEDCWVVKLDSSFNIIWQKTYGGTQAEYGSSVALSDDGKITVCGVTRSTDGDVIGNHTLGNRGYLQDIWVVQLDATSGVDSWHSDLRSENNMQIYPNPSESSVKLKTLPSQTITNVELYNIMGMPLSPEYTMENNTASVDVHSLPAGTCIARVTYFDGNHTGLLTLPLVVQH